MTTHRLFIFGTLCDADLRDLVVGRAVTPRPARLPDHRAMRVRGEVFPMTVPAPGAMLEGFVLDLDEREMARVVHFEDEVEFGLRDVEVRAGDGVETAVMFSATLEPSNEAWDLDVWRRGGKAFFIECAREIMECYEQGVDWSDLALWPGIKMRAAARANAATEPPRKGVGGLGRDRVETTRIERPYASLFSVEEHHIRHPRFDGGTTPELKRTVFLSGDAVTVVPYDPARDAVLLVTQWRAGPHVRGDRDPWPLEAVAGRIDANETAEAAARREAEEEAGVTLGRMRKVAAYYPSPGAAAEFVTAFVGEADLAGTGGAHGQPDEDEDILSLVVPFDEALEMVESFEANTSPVLITLLWLARHRAALREEWGGLGVVARRGKA